MKTRSFIFTVLPLLLAGCAGELAPETEQIVTEVETVVQETPEPAYPVISASLEDPDTRTTLGLNDKGAKVLWKKGDKFKALYTTSSNTYVVEYTTQEDGVPSATFTGNSSLPDASAITKVIAFYPTTHTFQPNGARYYIPSDQQAVKGSIEEGLNKAYAVATSVDENLRFKNAISLFQFKITGAAASQVAKVKFVATSSIAGDGIISGFENEEPTIAMNSFYMPRIEDATNEIVLNGPFEADTDYLIATVPCTTDGFSLIFIDEEGNYFVKHSSKEMTLKRSRITDIGAVTVNGFGDDALVQYTAQTKGSKPVDIMVIPDGFIDGQRAAFETRATQAMDFLFSVEPYKSLKPYFNVYFVWKASQEQGAGITDGNNNIQTPVNNAFGSRWGEGYRDMTADDDKVYEFASSHCPEIVRGETTIDEVPVLLIINDERYGGIAHTTSIGRTYCMSPYTNGGTASLSWSHPQQMAASDDPADGISLRQITTEELQELGTTSGDWRNIVLHEFGGHSIGRLADEYWVKNGNSFSFPSTQAAIGSHTWPVPFGLNASGFYENVPWQELLDSKASLVAKDSKYDRIGRYQGANTVIANSWRSERISCMIDNRPYFSTWQRALITKRILELAGETFDLNTFLASDDPTDPIRDNISTPIMPMDGAKDDTPKVFYPPLAPPVLTEIVSTPVEQ